MPALPPGRLPPSARAAALAGGTFLTAGEPLPAAGVLRTDEIPLFPSSDVALLTDEAAAGCRVVACRPTAVVLSDDGVWRTDEDELCLVDEEDEECLVGWAELWRVDDEAPEVLFVADDDGRETEVCLTDDLLSEDEERCEDDELTAELRLVDDEDCLAEEDEDCCLADEEDCLSEEDCLVEADDCLADEEVECLSEEAVRRLCEYPSVRKAASAMSIAAIAVLYAFIIIVV